MINILIFPFQLISIIIFFLIFPILFVYSWVRLVIKKCLKQKPHILFSPLSIPMNFLLSRSVKTQKWPVAVFSYDKEPIFEEMNYGYSIHHIFILRVLLALTTYLPIFIWGILLFDLFEFPFSGGILMPSRLRKIELILLKILAKKIVVYGYGSDSQIPTQIKKLGKYNAYMDFPNNPDLKNEKNIRDNIKRALKYSDATFSGLLKLGKNMLMVPLPVDLSKWKYLPTKNKKKITIVHSTNHRIYKGTRFIIPIIDELKKEKLPIKFELIEQKTIKECYQLYQKSDIIIAHVIGGWYGSTPCEGMALGRPVICYLDPKIARNYQYFAKDCPIVNANPDNLKQTIRKLVKNFKLRKELGIRGVEYVNKYHSFELSGKIRVLVYEFIWQGKKINQQIFEKELKKRNLI